MSTLRDRQNSRLFRLGSALIIGLVLLVGLLMALSLTRAPRTALAEGPTIRYVAPAPLGNDAGSDCTDSDAPCATLQRAVNVSGPGDQVRAAAGTYTSTGENVLLITETLTLIGGYEPPDWSSPVSHTTTRIDGERARRGIKTQGVISVTLSNLMVTRGRASRTAGLWQVTGLSRLEVRNARFEDNVVPWTLLHDGGGAMQTLGTVTLYNTEIISNHARKMGGGLYLRGPATLIETRVLGNSTYNVGGGMLSIGTVTVIDSLFKHNATVTPAAQPYYGGGGLYVQGGSVTLSGTRVISNTATRRGGGIHVAGGVLTMTNSVVADNYAATFGSGLYSAESSAGLLHTTISGNRGGDGSGVHVTGPGSTVALTNTILVGHGVGITVAAGSTATLDHTLWGAGDWANLSDSDGEGTIVTSGDIWGDPAFVDPDALDYHLNHDSAAINAGVGAGVEQDIDGDDRPCPCWPNYEPDLGADEFGVCLFLPLAIQTY